MQLGLLRTHFIIIEYYPQLCTCARRNMRRPLFTRLVHLGYPSNTLVSLKGSRNVSDRFGNAIVFIAEIFFSHRDAKKLLPFATLFVQSTEQQDGVALPPRSWYKKINNLSPENGAGSEQTTKLCGILGR